MVSSRLLARLRRPAWLISPVVALALVAGLIAILNPDLVARLLQRNPRDPQKTHVAEGRDADLDRRSPDPSAGLDRKSAPSVAWPAKGSAELDVKAKATAKPGGLPVTAAPAGTGSAGKIKVQVFDRAETAAAGFPGVALKVSPAAGTKENDVVRLSVRYKSFGSAFGSTYGEHLSLVSVPECAMAVPRPADCTEQPRVLASVNDGEAGTVTSDVTLLTSGNVLALAATPDASAGNWSATSLTPSSKWSVHPSTGGFSWSYPISSVPVPGGLVPTVELGYFSQAVDGQTAGTNNQGSWIGTGFTWEPGYIERRYKPCADDGHENVGDLCWSHQNATISFPGGSGELVKDGSTGEWHISTDSGAKVELRTGADNGDNNGEHWVVTTTDGTQYWFGQNRLPGWTSGKETTDSAWTVPVFGDDSGEPCHDATFSAASCDQAWRWNLDYVKDTHDNVISYFYGKEVNRYAKNANTNVNGTAYDRGGYLKRIDYGQQDTKVYSTEPPARIVFELGERCIQEDSADCSDSAFDSTPQNWPDTPSWLNCKANTHCDWQQAAPSFWTRKRLKKITTMARTGGTLKAVDSWSLEQVFKDTGGGGDVLWLSKIRHSGLVDGQAEVPAVELQGQVMPNRVGNVGSLNPLRKPRLQTIYNDTGGRVDIAYAPNQCSATDVPSEGQSTRRCFPVKWNPPGHNDDPVVDWFHKYVVSEVREVDRVNGYGGSDLNDDQVTRYTYQGDAGWRHAKPDGITKSEYLTWSEWRGYESVSVTRGDGQTFPARTDYTYLRGLNGGKKAGGGTVSSSVTDSTGTSHLDHDEFAGSELESIVYNGTAPVTKTITAQTRWTSATATHSWGDDTAVFVRPRITSSFVALASGGYRQSRTTTTYDQQTGRATTVDDDGDVNVANDERCTRIEYADNPTKNLMSLVKREEVVAAGCDQQVDRDTRVISDRRTLYDGLAYGATPTMGNVTKNQSLKNHDGVSATYITDGEGEFDDRGRPTLTKDAAGNVSTYEYVDTDGLNTYKKETSPLLHVTQTWYRPEWGVPHRQDDPNSKRTDLSYDPLGRLVNVWLPDRSGGLSPSVKYTYLLRTDQVTAVKTEKVRNDGGYTAEYQLFDGFLRPRQVQTEAPGGKRIVADTFYNSLGLVKKAHDEYVAAGAPSDQLLLVDNGDVDGQTVIGYDGAGRKVSETFQVAGEAKWSTTMSYGGDWTSVDPPEGGIPSTTYTDVRGNPVRALQYKGAGPSGDADTITYTYTPTGQVKTVTGPGGYVWSHEYDDRGRKTKSVGPDTGTVTIAYNDLDRLIRTTDARGRSLSYEYDAIGRRTGVYEGTSTSGQKLSGWIYDTEDKGQLYAEQRYVDGDLEKPYGSVILDRDDLYRPTQTRYIVPDLEGPLEGVYDFYTAYNRDGTVQSMTMPGAGDLPAEAIAYTYDSLSRVTKAEGANTYVTRTVYTDKGLPTQYELSTDPGAKTQLTWYYQRGTNRLDQAYVDRIGVNGGPDLHATYDYDAAGNIKRVTDESRSGTESQCFHYDYLRRLTEAWTEESTTCEATPSTGAMGGPAPYWHSYSYDATGNRTQEISRRLGSSVTRTYAAPTAGHRLPGVTDSRGAAFNTAYTYDAAGNTTGRTAGTETQTLEWDSEGHLSKVTGAHEEDLDTFRLVNLQSGLCLDVPSASTENSVSLQQYDCNGSGAQDWKLTPTKDGDYSLSNVNSRKCLDVPAASDQQGTVLQQYDCNGTEAQRWIIRPAQGGQEIVNKANGQCLSVQSGGTAAGVLIHQWPCGAGNDQIWNLTTGDQKLVNTNSGQCLDVPNTQTGNYIWLGQWHCATTAAQDFQFTYVAPGQFTLKNPNSQKCVDVPGGGTSPGTVLHQYDCNGSDAQVFRAVKTKDGYKFVNKNSSLCIDVQDGSTDPGRNIVQATCDPRQPKSQVWRVQNADSQATNFLYDASGNRLIRRDPNGSTLYLPGMEVRNEGGVLTATRYYTYGIGTVAMRTSRGVTFLAGDTNGTPQLAIDADDLSVVQRRTEPFGEQRRADGEWPQTLSEQKGFTGGTSDPTGLVHLGAREYDPALGRFISVDPVFDAADPQSWNGYAYANNSPITFNDVTGLNYPKSTCAIWPFNLSANCQGSKDDGAPAPTHQSAVMTGPETNTQSNNTQAHAADLRAAAAKQRLIDAAKALAKLAADELGITDAFNCVTEGDLGACGATVLNVATSFAGGLLAKLARKYAAPWKWKEGLALARKTKNLLTTMIRSGKEWWDEAKYARQLRRTSCNSFVPGTLVVMADGTARPIETIRPGEQVKATDERTGATTARTVEAAITGTGYKSLVNITVDTDGPRGSKSSTITATEGHPFWAPELKEWIDAGDLKPGMWLHTGPDTQVQITAIQTWKANRTVHNLTVAIDHTYYVFADTTPILVHNCDWTSPASLQRHFNDHGQDLGYWLKEDYEQGSKDLMCLEVCPAGVKQKTAMVDGKVYRWNPQTNEYGVKDLKTNKIITYFDSSKDRQGKFRDEWAEKYWDNTPGLED